MKNTFTHDTRPSQTTPREARKVAREITARKAADTRRASEAALRFDVPAPDAIGGMS